MQQFCVFFHLFSETVVFIINTGRLVLKKTVFSALASKLNMGLVNNVDMVHVFQQWDGVYMYHINLCFYNKFVKQ